jgi:3-mercaptopyruvate sulfurtransferase SseA
MTEIELDELSRRLGEVRVLDVRTLDEYDGRAGYHCDPRQGHIPGAAHLDVQELTALAPEELRARVGEPGEIVVYCHSGARSAFAAEVLRALGYDARNYPGSWHEWSRTGLPFEGR